MNLKLKNAIDKELRKERNKRRRIWVLLVTGLVLIMAVLTPVFSERVYGITTELATKDRSDVSKTRVKVKLDSGKVIVVMADSDLKHGTGQKVEISKMTSVAGMASYQFIQYVGSDIQ